MNAITVVRIRKAKVRKLDDVHDSIVPHIKVCGPKV